MTVKLTAKFFANARGLTLLDSASVTWAINSNTNEISATAAGGSGSGTVTNVATGTGLTGGPITTTGTISLANIADQRLFGNVSGGAAPPGALTAAQVKTMLAIAYTDVSGLATVAHTGAYSDLTGTPAGAALTKTNDTNVTLTLGGSPTTALLNAASLTLGWTGTLGLVRGGTGADLSGTGGSSQVLKQTALGGAVTVGQLAYTDITGLATVAHTGAYSDLTGTPTGAALTRTNDTNVTMTLGGSPTTALLSAASMTLGWTGTLGLARGGTATDLSATGGTSQVLKQTSAGGAVTVGQLAYTDISGLATVAHTGAYSDLSGAPTIVTSLAATLPLTVSASTGAVTVAGEYLERRTSNYTNTTTGSTDIFTGITTVANAVYLVEAFITTQCSSTGGNKFRITAPTGSTVEGWFDGTTSSVTTLSRQRITAINTLSGTAMNTVATTPAPLYVWALVTTSSTTGTLSVGGADVTSGQTNTVFAGSNLRISRIA